MTELKKLNLEVELNDTIEAVGKVICDNSQIREGDHTAGSNVRFRLQEIRLQFSEKLEKRQKIDFTKLTKITAHNVAVEIIVARSVIEYIDNSLAFLEIT
jgi:hypothetical protein